MRLMLSVFLLSSLAFTQTAAKPAQPPAPQSPTAATAPKPAEVPPADAIVITGFCPGKQATGADCKTEVSRTDFDKMATATGAPDAQKRRLADAYVRALVESTLARERGIDKKPQTQEILRLVEMQVLGQVLEREVREEASNVPQADIDRYYTDHVDQFEQATLQRIFIPKMPPNPQEKVDEAAVKAEGAKIAAAAKAPDADFAKLQKQAYEDLKLTATPPPTEVKDMRRENLPPTQAKIFDLEPGQVSDPLDETGGIYIYKVVSKKKQTEPEVAPEIKRILEQERFQAEMQKMVGNLKVDYNEAYFAGPAGERPPAPKLEPPQTQPAAKPTAPASKTPATSPKTSTTPKTPK